MTQEINRLSKINFVAKMVEASKKFATKKQHLVVEIKIEKKVSSATQAIGLNIGLNYINNVEIRVKFDGICLNKTKKLPLFFEM